MTDNKGAEGRREDGMDKTSEIQPLPEGFKPMSGADIAKSRRVAVAIGENNVRRYTWKRANKEQEARGWASTVTLTMESSVQHDDSKRLSGFINVAAGVLTYALDSLRFERARAEAAEAEVARLRADALLILGRYRGIDDCFDGEDRLMLGDDECEALDALSEAAFVSTDDVAAAIGRVLAHARPAVEPTE